MGANFTVYAYGIEDGLQAYSNIQALLVIQPIGFFEFFSVMGFPEFLINRANGLNEDRGGVDFRSSCLPLVKHIDVPTMLVQNRNDPWTDLEWVNEFYDELVVEKEMLWLAGSKKRLYAYDLFGHSPGKMLEWFGRYVK
jgi:hypothetical protein